jgi:hypothetical protein
MKRTALMIVLLVSLSLSCQLAQSILPGPPPSKLSQACRDSVDGMTHLTSGLVFPNYFEDENPTKRGGEFDANRYFEVLTHLSMQDGYNLDYAYLYDWMGGYPVMYARPTDEPPVKELSDLPQDQTPYLEYVQADGTLEGYLQYTILSVMADQFYLFWHANYNDYRVLCDQQAIQSIADAIADTDFGNPMDAKTQAQARQLDPGPTVEISGQTVTVELLVFTKWGGFERWTYTLDKDFPHRIRDLQRETLVPYDCGVMF